MPQVRQVVEGTKPLVVSIPHAGTFVPPDIKRRLTPVAARLPDTDWSLDRLYDFAFTNGCSVVMATHSRYVVDLNRPADDASLYPGQATTGLVPLTTFAGDPVYQEGEEPDPVETVNRIAAYWLPYHEALAAEIARIKSIFGYCIVYDAHSILSRVPRLFEGELPALNLGTVNGTSCDEELAAAVEAVMDKSGYSHVRDGRFIGGHITRHYGRPADHVHALQMELACKNYMDEKTARYDDVRATALKDVLKEMIAAALAWGERAYAAAPSSNQ